MSWFEEHRALLDGATLACRTRDHWTPFQESASRRHHPDGARLDGHAAFTARLGRPFPLTAPGQVGRVGAEVSPYTGEALGIDYPAVDPDALMAGVRAAWPAWRCAAPRLRTGVCLEMLTRLAAQSFENAFATMHTAGQSFGLAFAGSGANSLDRGLEGLAHAWEAMDRIPAEATFSRRFGPGDPVVLRKRYHLVPVGPTVVVSCGTYPAWNAYPAIFASLATGNPVIVKPHPDCVLPMAIAVWTCRAVLAEAGFDPDVLTLVADTRADPVTQSLLLHPDTAIVDFTGSQGFGRWIQDHARHAQVYTETAGCNAVVLESAADLDAALRAIAHGLCVFSSQMCTAAQNIWVPQCGVRDGDRMVPVDEVTARLVAAIDALVADPAHAAPLCGAIQSKDILDQIAALQAQAGDRVLRRSGPYPHPDFPAARTATPLLVAAQAGDHALYGREYFGPMAFVIQAADPESALAHAAADALRWGSIAAYAYTTDPAFQARVEEAFVRSGASVGVNLIRQRPINYAAAYSDFHVTGLNPAGTACLTDLAFVASRFRIVQTKVEQPPE